MLYVSNEPASGLFRGMVRVPENVYCEGWFSKAAHLFTLVALNGTYSSSSYPGVPGVVVSEE